MSKEYNNICSFLNIDQDTKTNQKETLCMNCSGQGMTTIVKTNIESFRTIQISHFKCSHCDYTHDLIKFVGEIPQKGVHSILHVKSIDDLKRNFIKSVNCTVKIPSINFQIPASSQGDVISTIEGVLQHSISCLQNETNQNNHLVHYFYIFSSSFVQNKNTPRRSPYI